LRGQNRGASLIPVLADFPEVASLGFGERTHGPVIDYQHVDSAEPGQQGAETAVRTSDGEVAKQCGGADVERRVS
jgi:hypothetical protein